MTERNKIANPPRRVSPRERDAELRRAMADSEATAALVAAMRESIADLIRGCDETVADFDEMRAEMGPQPSRVLAAWAAARDSYEDQKRTLRRALYHLTPPDEGDTATVRAI